MKTRIAVAALLIAVAAIFCIGSLAYFNYTASADNVITMGNVKIAVVEKQLKTETTTGFIPYPDEPITGVMPSRGGLKDRLGEKRGGASAWVRIKFEITVTLAGGTAETYIYDGDSGNIKLDAPLESWEKGADGWYYYNEILEPEVESAQIMSKVTFSKDMGNEYQNCTVDIKVIAEGVQSANNGAAYDEASGWPETTAETTTTE